MNAITKNYAAMDVKLLQSFRLVRATGSVTRAAASLGVTQPAVSAQIARLETEIGFALFDRTGNRLRPTQQGLAFEAEVERTLGSLSDLGRAAEQIRNGQTGSLVVAGLPIAGTTILPPVVAAFNRMRPDVRIEILTRNSDVIRGMFPSRTLDIGMAELPIDPTGLAASTYRMDCVAILPRDHPLAARDIITPELLSNLPFIGMSREWSAHHLLGAVFAERGARLNQVAVLEVFAGICALVAQGVGVSVVDPISAAFYAPFGLVSRPFRPAIPYDLAVFRSADRELSFVADAFLRELDRHLTLFSASKREKMP